MKRLRVTASLDPERTPALFDRLTNSPRIDEARVVDWNLAAEEAMLLFAIDGDPDPVREVAVDFPGVAGVEVSRGDGDRAHVLVYADRSSIPFFSCLASAHVSGGLVVRTPVVFRDGEIHACVLGDPGPLQDALAANGDALDVRIDEIASGPAARDPESVLSDGQREAVAVAVGLGYYEQPRGATHEDVAAELGCAPQTVSTHLQKAEAKLVRAAMDEPDSRI